MTQTWNDVCRWPRRCLIVRGCGQLAASSALLSRNPSPAAPTAMAAQVTEETWKQRSERARKIRTDLCRVSFSGTRAITVDNLFAVFSLRFRFLWFTLVSISNVERCWQYTRESYFKRLSNYVRLDNLGRSNVGRHCSVQGLVDVSFFNDIIHPRGRAFVFRCRGPRG